MKKKTFCASHELASLTAEVVVPPASHLNFVTRLTKLNQVLCLVTQKLIVRVSHHTSVELTIVHQVV